MFLGNQLLFKRVLLILQLQHGALPLRNIASKLVQPVVQVSSLLRELLRSLFGLLGHISLQVGIVLLKLGELPGGRLEPLR